MQKRRWLVTGFNKGTWIEVGSAKRAYKVMSRVARQLRRVGCRGVATMTLIYTTGTPPTRWSYSKEAK